MADRLRISLITPSFQQAQYLEECLRSVHDQQYPQLDHLVADGGSTDGSKEIIQAYSDRLGWWCSERDKGQSDSLNKALHHANGEIFGWINSDDLLLPGSLVHIGEVFEQDPDLLIYEGGRIILNADGSRVPAKGNDPKDRKRLFTRPCINQQSTFYRMSAVKAAGGVDPALHHVMDLELWWRILFLFGTDHIRIDDFPIADFRMHELSKTGLGLDPFIAEQAALLHSACKINGELDLASILAIGHDLPTGIRPMDVSEGNRELVREMTLAFLLKWNKQIYNERQFRMMKSLLPLVAREELVAIDGEAIVSALYDQLAARSWLLFRASRKWQHLFR